MEIWNLRNASFPTTSSYSMPYITTATTATTSLIMSGLPDSPAIVSMTRLILSMNYRLRLYSRSDLLYIYEELFSPDRQLCLIFIAGYANITSYVRVKLTPSFTALILLIIGVDDR